MVVIVTITVLHTGLEARPIFGGGGDSANVPCFYTERTPEILDHGTLR